MSGAARVLALAALVVAALIGLGLWGGLVQVTPAPVPATHHLSAGQARAVPAQRGAMLMVPVAGVGRAALRDDWGEARGGGTRAHHGLDIPAAAGTPVIAAGPGRIEKLFQSGNGGTTLYERSADGTWMYYYAHLAGYAPGVQEGQQVRAGDPIGYVGDTGDAGAGNYHLHFGLSRVAGRGWWQGEEVDPYPVLAGKPAPR